MMSGVTYNGEHSISFINQDWNYYPDFQHNFANGLSMQPPLTKEKYLGHKIRDDRPHDDRNTWEDWHLIPTSRPVVVPPPFNKNKISVKGASGDIDLTYSTAPWPTFGIRSGSWEFIVENGFKSWHVLQNEIAAFLHGRDVRVILQDDPTYYYEGLCEISSWNSNNDGTWSTITISYELQPYKKSIYNSIAEWEWNPFSFENGVIRKSDFKNIIPYAVGNKLYKGTTIYSDNPEDIRRLASWNPADQNNKRSSEIVKLTEKIGSMPVKPRFEFKCDRYPDTKFALAVRYQNSAIHAERYVSFKIKSGDLTEPIPDIIFYDSYKRRINEIQFMLGTNDEGIANSAEADPNLATVSIIFTPGEVL